jgi:cobalt/nickel transport system permease protein
LRHARVERWSRGESFIHKRHAAAKILAALVLLICISTLTDRTIVICTAYLALLVACTLVARLPLLAMLAGASVVLPFALCFALIGAIAGEPARALMLVIRAALSAFAALLLVATTPMPDLIAGLEWLHAPAFLLQVMQFLYRYLVVLTGEASAMRQASLARAGSIRVFQFRQAAAAAGVLFARSWARAQAIHRSMISRGFEGHIPGSARPGFGLADSAFAAGAALLITGLRVALR